MAQTYLHRDEIYLLLSQPSLWVQVLSYLECGHDDWYSLSSDENMMDPYNLAICFGPTLVTIPSDRDQVIHQNMVNELIKNFIIFHEDIFPNDGQGTVYEKYISSEPEFVR